MTTARRGWLKPGAPRFSQGCLLLYAAAICFACGGYVRNEAEPGALRLTIAFPEFAPGINTIADGLTLEGLTGFERDGRSVPRLAESWQSSTDGLRWTFRLRRPVLFHDGTPATATEIKQSLDGILRDPEARQSYPGLGDVRSVEVASEGDIVVRLRSPSGLLLDSLNVPLYKLDSNGQRVGTGPFMRSRTTTDQIEMVAHRQYNPRPPAVDVLVVKSYSTLRLAWASMMRGEVDFVSEVADDARELVKSNAVDVLSYQRSFFYGMAFNLRNPQLKPPAVRRALNLAVNREEIIRMALRGRGQVAWGPVSPMHWAHDRSVPRYTFDQKRALQELERAGYTVERGTPGHPPGRLRFTCIISRNNAVVEKLAMIVQQQLFEIGVDMRIRAVDKVVAHLVRGEFDAILMDINGGPTLSRPYGLWRSPSSDSPGFNFFDYRNTEVDAALDAIRYARSDDDVKRAMSRFQHVTQDDPPAVFLAWNERARALSRRFELPPGYEGDPLLALHLLKPRAAANARSN